MGHGTDRAGRWTAARTVAALLCMLACWATAALVAPAPAGAVINDTTGGGGPSGPTEGPCPLSAYDFRLEGNLVVVGLPFAGSPIKVDGTSAKLVGTKATAARICDVLLFQIPRFRWDVVATPPGQSATIADAGTLSPSLNAGGAGAYRLRLTACSPECRLTLSGRTRTIGPLTREVAITAVNEFTPPPETEALPPPLSPPPANWSGPQAAPVFTAAQRRSACQGGGGVVNPQWVTAEPFRGPQDYRSVEGEVVSSHVAAQDDFLNHDSQDQNWIVEPDPPFAGLAQPLGRKDMEMEAETDHLPGEFRPTSGDRAATMGYWIFDCGHDFRTEIHPPAGLAVERARAVEIPSSFRAPGFPNGFGTNVVVPGIVTDVRFDTRSGEITNNCSTTGLHGPAVATGVPQQPLVDGPCIREPHPLGRSFTFNVYLPRDPRPRALELGLNPPPVPLFVGIQPLGAGGGPDPVVQVRQDAASGATWLEVTVDLNGFTGAQYTRRIAAAWAYPQAQNWGARRWRVRLNNFKVIEDAEPDNPGPDIDDGDWRVFFNINNRDREWTRIFKCDGCVDEGDVKTLNLETGGPGLGADPVLFPGQRIFIHTTGFDDEVAGDDIGTIFLRMPQQNLTGVTGFSSGGEGIYHLNFSIRESTSVGGAVLTPEAAALMSAYTLRARPDCVLTRALVPRFPGDVVARPCGANVLDANLDQQWHPDTVVLRTRVLRAETLELFESEGEEEQHTTHGITVPAFRRLVAGLGPAERDRLLAEIRQELSALPARLRGDYDELVATLDRVLPARLVQRALPPGFRTVVGRFPLLTRG